MLEYLREEQLLLLVTNHENFSARISAESPCRSPIHFYICDLYSETHDNLIRLQTFSQALVKTDHQIKTSREQPKPLQAPTNDRFTFDDRELKYSEKI